MKSTLLALAALACSFSTMASTPTASQSVSQFCADRSSGNFAKELTESSENLMGFSNRGGLGNGGVCWWHSRFQRNALYLTIYKPGEETPSTKEAKEIIEKIRSGKEIVTIPGYRNFNEFSLDWRGAIQKELDKWQKSDGILKFNWVIGLSGDSTVKAYEMKEMMDELYDYVEGEGNIAYEKLQIKGIVAHAWLVVNMKKVDDGYDLQILDSNFPNQTLLYKYRDGMTHFNHYAYGNFVPYLERKGELDNIKLTILKKCDPDKYAELKGKARKDDEEKNDNKDQRVAGKL